MNAAICSRYKNIPDVANLVGLNYLISSKGVINFSLNIPLRSLFCRFFHVNQRRYRSYSGFKRSSPEKTSKISPFQVPSFIMVLSSFLKVIFEIQATSILQANEKTFESNKLGTVLKSFDWNQLASNNPQEDSLAIAQLCDNKSIVLLPNFNEQFS